MTATASFLRFAKVMAKRLVSTRAHAGSGDNNTIWRLARQGLPYYVRRDGWASFPMTVFFTINGRCNMRCRMCDIGEKNAESMFFHNLAGESGGDFPIERFKTLMDEFAPHKPYVALTTTEPLLYKPLWEAVDYAHHRGLAMNVTTNGLRIEKYVDEIMASNLHRLSVSIDGPEDMHNEMRRVPDAYQRIMHGIRLVTERKRALGRRFPEITVNSFIADSNHRRLLELVDNLPLDDIDHVNIKLMVFHTKEMVDEHNRQFAGLYKATPTCFPEDFDNTKFDIDELYRQTADIQRRYPGKVFLHFEPDKAMFRKYFFEPTRFMDETRCVMPWFVGQLTTDGDLGVYTRCYDLRFGSVLEQPFEQVWNGEKMRAFRRDLRQHGRFPACARCDGVLFR